MSDYAAAIGVTVDIGVKGPQYRLQPPRFLFRLRRYFEMSRLYESTCCCLPLPISNRFAAHTRIDGHRLASFEQLVGGQTPAACKFVMNETHQQTGRQNPEYLDLKFDAPDLLNNHWQADGPEKNNRPGPSRSIPVADREVIAAITTIPQRQHKPSLTDVLLANRATNAGRHVRLSEVVRIGFCHRSRLHVSVLKLLGNALDQRGPRVEHLFVKTAHRPFVGYALLFFYQGLVTKKATKEPAS